MTATKFTLACVFVFPLLQSCSSTPASTPPAQPNATTATASAPTATSASSAPIAPGDAHKACDLVTATEMSKILGRLKQFILS